MRYLTLLALVLLPCVVHAQYGPRVYYPRPYYGYYPGAAFGYFPTAYQSSWSNGYSLYGPPFPTYGSVPGSFGGADQRLSNYDPQYRFPPYGYNGYPYAYPYVGPWGGVGVVVPLNRPRVEMTTMAGPAICEVHVPTADTELFLNGPRVEGTGLIRKVVIEMPPRTGTTMELEARWTSENKIGSARRWATLRAGETTSVNFNSPSQDRQ